MTTSSKGVVLVANDIGTDRAVLSVPKELLIELQAAWMRDDDLALTTAVRNLFDGQDGHLTFLCPLLQTHELEPPLVVVDNSSIRPTLPTGAAVKWQTMVRPPVDDKGARVGDRWEHPFTGERAVLRVDGWVSL